MAQEKVYSELLDLQSSARNIILFNISELSNSPSQTRDISIVENVFNSIGTQANPVAIH